jgi:hypothetical protein
MIRQAEWLGAFLFLRDLQHHGITMKKNGEPGKGAQFEIMIPAGMFRIRKGNGRDAGNASPESGKTP